MITVYFGLINIFGFCNNRLIADYIFVIREICTLFEFRLLRRRYTLTITIANRWHMSLRSVVVLRVVQKLPIAGIALVAWPLPTFDRRFAYTEHIGRTLVAEMVAVGDAALEAALFVLVGALAYELGAAAIVSSNAGANGAPEHLIC